MTIAFIGQITPDVSYQEWENTLSDNVQASSISLINITNGKNTLNEYAKRYASKHKVPVMEYGCDFKSYGEDARLLRNQALLDNSRLIVGFLSKDGSIELRTAYNPKDYSREKTAQARITLTPYHLLRTGKIDILKTYMD